MLAKELAEKLMEHPDMMVFCYSDASGDYYSPEIILETVENVEYYEMYNGNEKFIPEENMKYILL
jgi:glutamine amidotransferase-like uncharacterized protein